MVTLDEIAGWLREAESIVVLTGAGISTESGIPDFRGPSGVWTKDPDAEKMATIQYYVRDADVRRRAWRHRLESDMWSAEPNAGHHALAELEGRARLDAIVTQNVDGLHQRAGSTPEKVIEVHGTVHEVECLTCGRRAPMGPTLDRVRAGEEDPLCRECGGLLKSATISFGQDLVPEVLRRAQQSAADCDVFLAIGTSLAVYPAAALPELAVGSGATLVIMNEQPTPLDPYARAVVPHRIGEVLPALVALV
ncbi:MAG: NAD-dependent deacylase [Acidimicrobiia bacterium]